MLLLSLRRLLPRSSSPHSIVYKRMVQGVAIENGCLLNRNPATGDLLGRVRCTTLDELETLVAQAATAQPHWSRFPLEDRINLLSSGLEAIATQTEALTQSIVREMGKPLAEAAEEMQFATQKQDYLQVLQEALRPKQHGSCTVVRQPFGVVAVLSPWNFPVDEILLLTLPALASGNSVVVKPSEVTPETGATVVQALSSQLPPGVLQLAQGDGSVGAALVQHPSVHLICMTGSSATGRKILASAAPHLKRLVLELGGKDPMVVLPDADVTQASHDAVAYSLSNAGQVCCSVEKVLVPTSLYDEFAAAVVEQAKSYRVGNGLDEGVQVGPLVSTTQRDHVASQVQQAVEQGATLLYQSALPAEAPEGSSFYPVTVLGNVSQSMRVYTEETFGPVVSLIPYDGTEEVAIALANDTEYGLAASVYSSDAERAQAVASQIQAGQVGINCYSLENLHPRCPWVGHKQSGFGYHSGEEGFHQFSVPKTIVSTSK